MIQPARPMRKHKIFWRVMRALVRPIARLWLGFTASPAPDTRAPVLVLANHNTDYDPALVALSFRRQMYFVASEHIFRWGWISRVFAYLLAPIPLLKGGSDAHAAKAIFSALRMGQSICLFAEGNRSVDGLTAPISPATGMLAKAGADLITYKIEGGYFTSPRWAKTTRRGRMYGHMVGHYPAAALKEMTAAEINEIIRRDLHEDAYALQAERPIPYRGKRRAEHLETALYLCPACGGVGALQSEGDRFFCACGLSVRYTETGFFEGERAPFHTVAEWYAWQIGQAASIIARAGDGPIFSDPAQKLYSVDPCVNAALVATGTLSLTRKALCLGHFTFPLEAIRDLAIVGQMTLTFTLSDARHYEIKSDVPRSGYKYLHALDALRKESARKNT